MNAPETVSILDGSTFVVSDGRGDIEASPTDTRGLFHRDTRHLSRWLLTVNGERLHALSTDNLQYFATQFFLVASTGTVYVDAKLSVIRKRAVGDGFHEDITILNHASEPFDLDVRLEAASDFADLFEVKDALTKKGEYYRRTNDGKLVLGYKRERFVRETAIETTPRGEIDDRGLRFQVRLPAHSEWTVGIDVVAVTGRAEVGPKQPKHTRLDAKHATHGTQSLDENVRDWIATAPRMITSSTKLQRTYERSLVDLAALRFFSVLAPGQPVPAAGLPWFMAVFGRDSLITSYQALPFFPDMAAATLRVLGQRQGTHIDDFRDEEPGRILHEARWGELTAFEERPHSPYFGSADATPLFLVLLEEYVRWTGDRALAVELEEQARAALKWIDDYGDRDGDGYVEYDRRNTETGLENQCWKDSWDSIAFADGRLAQRPLATCEIQGYVYDAKVRTARLAREVWKDTALAEQLETQAAELKRRFNADFWLPERKAFALALDRDKKRVDSLTSNIGHLLWSGIVDDDKAGDVVKHLMGDELFSGWGIRTMASAEARYNPIGYHVGTVWPHDCSMIAFGLRRYGRKQDAARLALGILEAANFFDHRLPEAFAGYDRERTKFPVEYPTACSPQAWATGAPLLMLRTLLGLEPVGEQLLVDPALPASIAHVGLTDIPGRWGHVDAFGRGHA